MLIGVKKRFVFIANSKTASTSIEHTLVAHAEIQRGGTAQRKHIHLRDALIEYDFLFGQSAYPISSFFTFGVMRDPLDWITSWYRYRRGNKVESRLPADMAFADFWAMNDWNRSSADGKPLLQSDYFLDKAGAPIVDYIIPYEDLAAHFSVVCAGLGVPQLALASKNVSVIKTVDDSLSPALMAEIRSFYATDYALRDRIAEINAAGAAKLAARKAGMRA